METFFTVLILLLVVCVSGIITRILPVHLPLPLVQIATGAFLAWPAFGLKIEFNPELFLMLFIPPLLFSDGRKTSVSEFIQRGRETLSLALVLVFVTVVGVGYLIHYLVPDIPLPAAFALAAVLSPTDAVALSGIVGKGRISKPVMDILESEALMNDASGLVSLNFAIAVALGVMIFSMGEATMVFLNVAAGGLLIGVLITLLFNLLLKFINKYGQGDPAIQIILSILLPFAAYLMAEKLTFSGILAAVAAGITIGQSKMSQALPHVRLHANSIWGMLEFVFNGMVFILLGFQLPGIYNTTVQGSQENSLITFNELLLYVAVIYAGLMLCRFLWVLTMKYLSKLNKKKPMLFAHYSMNDILITTFSGVRGAVTLAGVLSIPLLLHDGAPFPGRYELVFIASGVIIISIIAAIVILPFLLKRQPQQNTVSVKDGQTVHRIMANSAINTVSQLKEKMLSGSADNEQIKPELIDDVSNRVLAILQRYVLTDEEQKESKVVQNLEKRFLLTAIHAERDTLNKLKRTKRISQYDFLTLANHLDLFEIFINESVSADDE